VDGTVDRSYLVDESGSIVELIIPGGVNAGTYLVTYNGHGDALALWRIRDTWSVGSIRRGARLPPGPTTTRSSSRTAVRSTPVSTKPVGRA